jgi:hypothetical protein
MRISLPIISAGLVARFHCSPKDFLLTESGDGLRRRVLLIRGKYLEYDDLGMSAEDFALKYMVPCFTDPAPADSPVPAAPSSAHEPGPPPSE